MPNILLSGPAGAGKSQLAARLRRAAAGPAVVADFQLLYLALVQDERGPDGSYPHRDEALLPIVEAMRREVIEQARQRGIEIVATNSDGDADRRADLLARLGPTAEERIIDPGEEVVTDRLRGDSGELDPECAAAIGRWYSRL